MGTCVSTPTMIARSGMAPSRTVAGGEPPAPSTTSAKVVHVGDGRAREYVAGAAKAGRVEADNPGYGLCSCDALHVGRPPARSAASEYLQPGQVYLLLPAASLAEPLTLQDLCRLAVVVSAALRRRQPASTATAAGERRRATSLRRPGKAST